VAGDHLGAEIVVGVAGVERAEDEEGVAAGDGGGGADGIKDGEVGL
jgi:hypothetical protein